ncbi:hypothetical protein EXN00_14995 [Clostridium botulinum]|uniref:Uncharacterized protein n=2 Tax=Clostridium botulinum TaxID=1491 RepID=A5I2B7_CLOBH|nr:hypothetical protein DB732_08990 [Clostridium botulinum]CAL83183.1 hypothetical protein CBO1648 [Clostridium botulinum A str. ATCC 3502]AWB30388.1 hypothetical protein DBN47_08960 [Clostridium botulinum]EGT5615919.1 hypothetical protein [Clostridium botulinum]EGT5622801.1 hypothetical protein [Clostridium botulinum]
MLTFNINLIIVKKINNFVRYKRICRNLILDMVKDVII